MRGQLQMEGREEETSRRLQFARSDAARLESRWWKRRGFYRRCSWVMIRVEGNCQILRRVQRFRDLVVLRNSR